MDALRKRGVRPWSTLWGGGEGRKKKKKKTKGGAIAGPKILMSGPN